MRMNPLVNFAQFTKVVRMVFGYNPFRNASGRSIFCPKRALTKHAQWNSRCWRVGSVYILSRLRGTQKMTRVMWKIRCSSAKDTVYSGDPPRYLFEKEGKMTRPLGIRQICNDESYPIYIFKIEFSRIYL